MENLNQLKARINDLNPEFINLCSDFLVLYSRFEYALKEQGFLQRGNNAVASIDNYISSISFDYNSDSEEDLSQAIDYILADPPRKLMVGESELRFEEIILTENIEVILPEYIRRIRNSLMHGAKFYGEIETDSRNWRLIDSAMIIIENWINLNDDLKNRFRLD